MTLTDIRIGQTHTSRMLLGRCPICGLGHPKLVTSAACVQFREAAGADNELIAWQALKAAVAAVAPR